MSRERSATRFTPYIQELREFFLSRGMRVGSPEDIIPLARHLATPGSVNEDITSIVRSIIFREHEAIPRPDLLRILVIATAGAPIAGASGDVEQALDQLHAYVGEVIASLRRRTYVEEVEDAEDPVAAVVIPHDEPVAETVVGPSIEEKEYPEERLTPENPPPSVPLILSPPPPAPTAAHCDEPNPIILTPFRPSSELQPHLPTDLLPIPVAQSPTSRRALWITSLCALFLAFIVSLLWWQKSPDQPALAKNPNPLALSTTLSPEVASNPAIEDRSSHQSQPKPSAANPNHSVSSRPVGESPASAKPAASTIQPSGLPPAASPRTSSIPQPPAPPPAHARPRAANTGPALPTSQLSKPSKPGSFLVSSGVMDGNLITVPTTPSYPKWANMTGVEGQVILQAVVSRNGNVVATHVLEGHRMLRGAATHAVRTWRYRPYMVHGKPTDVATIVIVDFHLHH